MTKAVSIDVAPRKRSLTLFEVRDLPAPAYSFAVDLDFAKKGEILFQENCAACHKPHNGEVYDMGTDLGRARVVSEAIAQGARASFTGICPPSRTVKMPPSGTPLNPCAEFENVSLENKAELIDPQQVRRVFLGMDDAERAIHLARYRLPDGAAQRPARMVAG